MNNSKFPWHTDSEVRKFEGGREKNFRLGTPGSEAACHSFRSYGKPEKMKNACGSRRFCC